VTTSPLRAALEETGQTLDSLTVLAEQNDPFRLDTDANHRDGKWLAVTATDLGIGSRRIHLRGLHYAVIGRTKPNGQPYANTAADWGWLSERAGKAARWLGYIPFDQIVDQRNSAPEVRIFAPPTTRAFVSTEVSVEIPDADQIEPYVRAYHSAGGQTFGGFGVAQPYKLVMIGEKSSLEDVLGPIARNYKADLYLPTGECSDTLIHQMARVGAEDGRPMVVFYFSDADPSGWQMPVSVARKLQAFRVLEFADLDFEVHRVALTPEQVRAYGLPSTPLKATEKRADDWQQAMGVAQTEIDALASLQPALLRQIANDALDPYFDRTLDRRATEAYSRWQAEAQAALMESLDSDRLDRIRADAAERLGELREQIDAINEALRVDADDLDLPPIVVPEPELDGPDALPLVDSRDPFTEQCSRLIASRAYRLGGGA
jgi:hypothetical protein